MSANPYHRLPIAEKRALAIGSQREAAVTCPTCDTHVMPVDMPSHTQRCEGPRAPGPLDRWVSARDPIVRDVPKGTRSYWVQRGFVRVRGEPVDREYLLRDLAKRIAIREGFRRR
jgi:hypothetical protein